MCVAIQHCSFVFFFQAEDGIRAIGVTGVQTCALPILWNTGGCSSWYLDEHGKNTVLWGGYTWQYWRATRSVKPAEYQFLGLRTGSRTDSAAVAAQG